MKLEAASRWYRAMAPVHQTMGMLVRLFSKPMYDYHRNVYNHWVKNSPLRGLECTKRAVYVYNPILFNARVRPHRDDQDMSGTMVLMTCTGDFKDGGNIIVPLAKKQYKLRSGGVILLNGTLLEHGVGNYSGTRISFVNTIHEDMCNLEANNPPPADQYERQACPFCQTSVKGETALKRHLAPWRRKAGARSEDLYHKVAAILKYCHDQGWKRNDKQECYEPSNSTAKKQTLRKTVFKKGQVLPPVASAEEQDLEEQDLEEQDLEENVFADTCMRDLEMPDEAHRPEVIDISSDDEGPKFPDQAQKPEIIDISSDAEGFNADAGPDNGNLHDEDSSNEDSDYEGSDDESSDDEPYNKNHYAEDSAEEPGELLDVSSEDEEIPRRKRQRRTG